MESFKIQKINRGFLASWTGLFKFNRGFCVIVDNWSPEDLIVDNSSGKKLIVDFLHRGFVDSETEADLRRKSPWVGSKVSIFT